MIDWYSVRGGDSRENSIKALLNEQGVRGILGPQLLDSSVSHAIGRGHLST